MSCVLCVGEALLRLSPPEGTPLEDAASMQVAVGGSELNVAAGLAQLGIASRLATLLPDQALGRRVLGVVRSYGVDTREVRFTASGRLGLYYLEQCESPRGSTVIYDRADSTFAHLPGDAFVSTDFQNVTHLHVSGISLVVSQAARVAVQDLITRAGAHGLQISFDVNHRAALCAAPQAADLYGPALSKADLIFIAERDLPVLFPERPLSDDLALALHALNPQAQIIVTRGASGSALITSHGARYEHPALPARGPGRVGRGDAFAAGFLCSWMKSGDPREALAWGAAAAALKMTTTGDQLRATQGDIVARLAPRPIPFEEDIQR